MARRRQPGRRARAAEAKRLARAERFFEEGAVAAADTLYRQILDRNPTHTLALSGRAAALVALERSAEELCAFARQCSEGGLFDSAARCYGRARELEPDNRDAVWGLADCSMSLGDDAAAVEGYRRYLELEPGEPEALHMLAALGEEPAPQRAADDFITDYFDRFAADFDRQLIDELCYRVPEHLFAALSPFVGEARGHLAILDLGCGTGLSGRLFRPHAERLDGVDLSPRMIEKARERGVYDSLNVAEAERHLAETDERYDVIVAGDVLTYFGSLGGVFEGAARALLPAGLFAFSVEADELSDYRLMPSGRYVHGRDYVRRCALAAGLREDSVTSTQLRLEYGAPVAGDIWLLEKPV